MLFDMAIPESALSVSLLEPGFGDFPLDGLVHRKTAPATIIARAVSGSYEVTSPRGSVVAREGEAFIALDGEPLVITHHARRRGGRMRAQWLHARFLLFGSADVTAFVSLPLKTNARTGAKLGRIIDGLLARDGSQPLAHMARRNELGFSALRLLLEHGEMNERGAKLLDHQERLVAVFDYVRDRLSGSIAIGDLCRAAHLSRSRFHALFQRTMGQSPMSYVKSVRLLRGRDLLLTTDKPVKLIAQAAGFQSQYHFSREFRAAFGMPPTDYRLSHAELAV